jgi:hypothetical protein
VRPAGAESVTPFLSTAELRHLTGLTRRQIDWWVDRDQIRAENFSASYRIWHPKEVLRALIIRRMFSCVHTLRLPRRLENKYLAAQFLLACRKPKRAHKAVTPVHLVAVESVRDVLKISTQYAGAVVLIPVAEFRDSINRLIADRNAI